MWRMHDGDRVLTDAEWDVFRTGLGLLRHFLEEDIASQTDDTDTGVPAFDRLTAEQKLALLAEVATALRDPAVPTPHHTAANEGAIMAVLVTFRDMLRSEVEADEEGRTDLRKSLLAAVADGEDRPKRLPTPSTKKWEVWDNLYHSIVERLFWDYDFAMGDEFLDLPPDEARAKLDEFGIDPDYYLEVPAEPGEKGLITARQTLARLIGLAVPDDDGLYTALLDRYHDLSVGPVTPDEIAAWENNPWIEIIGSTQPEWECDFPAWQSGFSGVVPAAPFTVSPAKPHGSYEFPGEIRTERSGEGWVVRD